MKKRIFRSMVAVILTALLVTLGLTAAVYYTHFHDLMMQDLEHNTAYIAHAVEQYGMDYLTDTLPRDSRVTWIAPDGTVLFDNWEDIAGMENHAGREEVQEAMTHGLGMATRYSDTLAEQTVYYALRLEDGSVLRTANTSDSVWNLVYQAVRTLGIVLLPALAVTLWLAGRISRQLVAPINAIDLREPSDDGAYEELAPFLARIRSQNRQIRQQMEDLRRQQEEFSAITVHMSEGLLVIDTETRVLSYNPAALRLLRVEAPAGEGTSILEWNREAGFRRCVEAALQGKRHEELLESGEECRSVLASPVTQEGKLTGAVLVVMDVTEKEQRERLRREFTANVSHELKTPLTSILGTAEILKNGMVRPEDVSHFAGNIHRETRRLIGLVNDIIKLSRLDEGGMTDQWQPVELYALACGVKEQLAAAAEERNVAFSVAGSSAMAFGVPAIMEEIIYNLCDNAVAYNRPGGSVSVTVENTPEGPRVTVRDTGIGIPPEAQSRVFERFYRVDKSHSGGGTGLGLSIVKHGAAYLKAQVSLESEEGRGSTFRVTFLAYRE